MKHYKKWSPQERMVGYNKVKKAIANGELKKPEICKFCSNKHDIHYHQEDYDDPLNPENLHEVCFRCHIMMFHCYDKLLQKQYKKDLKEGKKFKEVFHRGKFLEELKKKNYE